VDILSHAPIIKEARVRASVTVLETVEKTKNKMKVFNFQRRSPDDPVGPKKRHIIIIVAIVHNKLWHGYKNEKPR